MNNYISNYLNINLAVYYLNTLTDTVNIFSLNSQLKEINNNINKYMGTALNGLNLEIWNSQRQDIPKNNNNIMGISSYAGLTWFDKNLVQSMLSL